MIAKATSLLPLLLLAPACGSDDGITGPFSGSHVLVRTQTSAATCPGNLSEDFPAVYTVELEHVADGVIIRSLLGQGLGDPPTGDPPVLQVTINGTEQWGGSADYQLVAEEGEITGDESATFLWNPTPTSDAQCEASWTLAPIAEPN